MDLPLAKDAHPHPRRQSVHDGNPDAVEPAGNGIAVPAEFPAGMEDRQHDFHRRFPRLVHPRRNPAAVVDDRAAPVLIDRHFDMRTIACQRFIDTVIDDFVHQMMQPTRRRRADVHPRTKAHRLQPFQDANILRAVILLPHLLFLMRGDFMNVFAHNLNPYLFKLQNSIHSADKIISRVSLHIIS